MNSALFASGLVMNPDGSGQGSDGNWDLQNFIAGFTSWGENTIGLLIILGGTVLVGFAVWVVVSKLVNPQSQQSWFKGIIALIVGGALMIGGFGLVASIGEGGKQTIDQIGRNTQ